MKFKTKAEWDRRILHDKKGTAINMKLTVGSMNVITGNVRVDLQILKTLKDYFCIY